MSYKITSEHSLEAFFQSLRGSYGDGKLTMRRVVPFTVPHGEGQPVCIWDGTSLTVEVCISSLHRIDDEDGYPSGRWQYTGSISSLYDGVNGRAVTGIYSLTDKSGTLIPE